jgi:hypothetical protein
LATTQGRREAQAALAQGRRDRRTGGRRARSTVSSVEPHRALVERWAAEGVSGVVIHDVLGRENAKARR